MYYYLGPGSIPWFFVTELFSQSGRPIASSIAVAVNWSANFLVGLGFSPIQVYEMKWHLYQEFKGQYPNGKMSFAKSEL